MNFNVIDENNKFKVGNIVTVFKIDGIDKEFALFTVEDFDTELSDLNVAYIEKDSEGYDNLKEIDDEEVFTKAIMVVKDMISKINK